MKRKRKVLVPCYGYRLTGVIYADDEQAVLDFCLGMSDDPKFQQAVRENTHQERLDNLLDNGFSMVSPPHSEGT